jgi:hypothetical protein
MVKRPYVGVTGFMNGFESYGVLDVVPPDSEMLIMVGVLASLKTLRGIPHKRPNRYPKAENIKNIFPPHRSAFNLIHYKTNELDTLTAQLFAMTQWGGLHMHGFQLNIAWPSPKALELYKLQYSSMQIVLQVGNHALEAIENSPKKLADKIVLEYANLVDYVLLDQSGGEGKMLNVGIARTYLEELYGKNLGMGFGVAGGLCAETLHRIEPLTKYFSSLCTDAEGRVRNSDDTLNVSFARDYISANLRMRSRK